MLALVLLAAALYMGWYRAAHHTFDLGRLPDRIGYCGREYGEGYHTPAPPKGDWAFARAFTIWPAGWQVYTTKPAHSAPSYVEHAPPLPCTMGLVLQPSDHEYVQYGLMGGP